MWQVSKRSPVQFQVCLRQCHFVYSSALCWAWSSLNLFTLKDNKNFLVFVKELIETLKKVNYVHKGSSGWPVWNVRRPVWCYVISVLAQFCTLPIPPPTATTTTNTTTTTITTMLSTAQFTGKNYVCTNSRLFAPSMSPRAIASLSRNISCLEIPDDRGMPNYELVFCHFSF